MPYIIQPERDYFAHGGKMIDGPGQLSYLFTGLIHQYMVCRDEKGRTYATFNDILGALEGAKLEFYRRVVAPHEDLKKEQNGDVY